MTRTTICVVCNRDSNDKKLAAAEAKVAELTKEYDELQDKLEEAERFILLQEAKVAEFILLQEAKVAELTADVEKWKYAFGAQSAKLEAVLHIPGVSEWVREKAAELDARAALKEG